LKQLRDILTRIYKYSNNGVRPTVPIIEDFAHDGKVVQDSWEIAKYLEETYPDTPSLFHGTVGVHKAFEEYSAAKITPILFKMSVLHIHENCGSKEIKDWFREDRERKFGMTLEQFAGDANALCEPLKENLKPAHTVLSQYPYVTGDKGKNGIF
jgi:glutathione S-transferase